MPTVVTANDLRTGAVVYLGRERTWVRSLADAAVAEDPAALAALSAVAQEALARAEVVAVYAMDVRTGAHHTEPVSVRETIRAAGAPTI